MDFEKRYELLEPVPGEGAKSFKSRHRPSGREVTVHLLTGAPAAAQSVLAELRRLPDTVRQGVETGDNEGTPYVVTPAPPHRGLRDWIRAHGGEEEEKFGRAGQWKVPAGLAAPHQHRREASPEPPPAPPPVPEAVLDMSEPEPVSPLEATRFFSTPKAQPGHAAPPPPDLGATGAMPSARSKPPVDPNATGAMP